MVDIGFGYRAVQQFQCRQQHGTQGPEQVFERGVASAAFGQALHNSQKIRRHQKVLHRAGMLTAEQFKQLGPVRRGALHQIQQCLPLGGCQWPGRARTVGGADGLIQKVFPQSGHVGRNFIAELSPLFAFRPDGNKDELMFRHLPDEHLHPG